MLWRCWLGVRKSIQPVHLSNGCWYGYLSESRCKWFAYGPADATATPIKIQNASAFLVPAYPGCPGKKATKWL